MISIINNVKMPPEAEVSTDCGRIQGRWLSVCAQAYFEIFIRLEIYLPSRYPEIFIHNKRIRWYKEFFRDTKNIQDKIGHKMRRRD
ncbi:hypothetical protein AOQ84DRAFT_25875 [Glonium stellatum]|uniref:Uncharacterized protein n=1 Tax=Glonium stellatum TaxID=574774 RepID=A0A8E2F334_9PEZI|nr:hypothetical protein AOQ84DRAFT_25875 [Glonium stellatum]